MACPVCLQFERILQMYSPLKSYFFFFRKINVLLYYTHSSLMNAQICGENSFMFKLQYLTIPGKIDRNYFMGHISNFYHNCMQYLYKSTSISTINSKHDCIQLKRSLKWADVEHTYQQSMVQMHATAMTLAYSTDGRRWKSCTEQRWLEVFGKLNEHQIPYKNCPAIVECLPCLPETDAPAERVFSLMNITRTSEKSPLKVETLRAISF
ncbi:hypothetical protein PR048_007891, partial [Dryococelus australis]